MVAEAAPGFVGRERELELLAGALAEAETARAVRCVVVEGEAGIGKSSLLRTFLAAAPGGGAVVLATAEAAEELVDHALADQLLRAAGVERPAVLAGDGDGDGPAPGLATVGLRLLEAFTDGAVRVVAVDDAQWADAASLRALLFAVRRTTEEPLLLLLGVRSGTGERIPDGFRKLGGMPPIALGGLGDAQVGELAQAAGRPLSASAARRLREHTRGNPLYVRALLAEMPASAWELPELLAPAPELFARHALRRLAAAGESTRALIEAAAVIGVRSELQAAAAVAVAATASGGASGGEGAGADGRADVGGGAAAGVLEALEAAERTGLVAGAAAAREVVFDHPLTRAAVYHALGPARRARLHAAAAEAVGHRGQALLHRAAATAGPDPALADELDAFAAGEALRSAWESAAEAYAAAARVSDGAARERRELEAADALLGAGRVAAARARLGDRGDDDLALSRARLAGRGKARPSASPTGDGGDRRGRSAQLASVLAYLAMHEGRLDDAERLLALAWEQEGAELDVRRRIAERRAVIALGRVRPEEALTWARRSAELPLAPIDRLVATWPLALAHAQRGDHAAAFAVLDRIIAEGGDVAAGDVGFRGMRGRLRLAVDDLAGALEDLRAAAAAAPRLGWEGMSASVHATLARAELAAGDWDAAVLDVERAQALVSASQLPFARGEVHDAAFAVALARGDLAAAGEHVEALRDCAVSELGRVALAVAAARLAAARARPEAVLAAIDELGARAGSEVPGAEAGRRAGGAGAAGRAGGAEVAGRAGGAEVAGRAGGAEAAGRAGGAEFGRWALLPADLRLAALEAEALTQLGRLEEADAVLLPREERARQHGLRSLAAELARARGRLEAERARQAARGGDAERGRGGASAARGHQEAAVRAFEAAVAGTAELGQPHELALSQVALGGHLRRRGQRRRAAELLEAARDVFARLGAVPDLERCERELAASGLAPARRSDADRTALTARERAVAQLAADGLTNREIAAELMVSAKTVEVHLTRVFAKLGVGARTELPARLG